MMVAVDVLANEDVAKTTMNNPRTAKTITFVDRSAAARNP
jgi:hypothetical protein